MKLNPLNRKLFYRGFRKYMQGYMSFEQAEKIWEEAGQEYKSILFKNPGIRKHKGAMVLPAAALYRVLSRHGRDISLLQEYGTSQGQTFGKMVHWITSVHGAAELIWKHIADLTDRMSSEQKGYKRKLVSQGKIEGVDILSCPYHELAKELGCEKAVLYICAVDKEYSQGFHHIRYDRLSSLGEGDAKCEYRLQYDQTKK